MSVGEDLLIGRRSGFAFWVDRAHDNRKVLVAIRGQDATRHDYYDGPFDQLADSYVDETGVANYVIQASPSRVSISPYYVYFTDEALHLFVSQMKLQGNPYFLVSRKGVLPTSTP